MTPPFGEANYTPYVFASGDKVQITVWNPKTRKGPNGWSPGGYFTVVVG